MIDVLASGCLLAGAFFFAAGAAGLLRFPDTLSRLHALTKVDNTGLGMIALGLALHAGSWVVAGALALIWLLALIGGAGTAYLMAGAALDDAAERRNAQ